MNWRFICQPELAQVDRGGLRAVPFLNQTECSEARLTLATYHHMIMNGDTERLERGHQFASEGDVLAAGFGIARWMIVNEDKRR